MAKRSRLYDYTKEELQEILDNSTGYINALRLLGIGGTSSKTTLIRIIEEYNLSIKKLEENRNKAIKRGQKTNCIPIQDILVENSTYTNMTRLKIRLISEGFKENVCEECGISEWNNKPITLQIHHKNGKHNDHRLKNISLLCPNCHSQTDNYAGANNI